MSVHIEEEEGLEAMRVLAPKVMIPIHWEGYRTAKEKIELPVQELLTKAGDLEERVQVLKVREPI